MNLGPWLVTRGVFFGITVLVIFSTIVTTGASFTTSPPSEKELNSSAGPLSENDAQLNVDELTTNPINCRISNRYPDSILRWCDLITQYSDKYGLAPDLVAALIWQESGGKPRAYSRSGAVGLMQVMPRDGLAASFMCKNGPCFFNRPTIKELQDPEYNVKYGTRMLARLVEKNGGLREGLKAYGPMDVGYYYANKVLGIYEKYGS